MGKRRLIKQNKIFISIIAILFILFGFTLYFGGNQIYEKEAKWQHGNTVARLLSGKEIIEKYFSEFRHNLFFLRDIPAIRVYVNSNFESTIDKDETAEIFHSFTKAYRQYTQIGIIDSSGREILRVDNKQNRNSFIVSDSNLKNEKYQHYFQETIKLDKDLVYASPIHLNIEQENADTSNVPIVRLATPLFNSKNEKKGILILDLHISKVLELLILVIGYLNVVRFRELIGAQKAIIFSLAGLTERRDPETGQHRERTKKYTAELAKQLRKNKKYRKLFTSEFIAFFKIENEFAKICNTK